MTYPSSFSVFYTVRFKWFCNWVNVVDVKVTKVRKTKHRSIVLTNPVTQVSTTFLKKTWTLFLHPHAALSCTAAMQRHLSCIPLPRGGQAATAFSLWWRLNSPASVPDTTTYSPPHSQCRHMNCTSPLHPAALGAVGSHIRWIEYLAFIFS